MSNEIQTYEKLNDQNGIEMLGKAIFGSAMFGCESIEQGQVLALQCVTEGKPPLELAKTYHIIQGKLTKRADAMLADFRRAGGKIAWLDLGNREKQEATFEWEGQKHNVSMTFEQASQAGMTQGKNGNIKDNWKNHPSAMLRARITSETLRAIAPELVQGTYEPSEIEASTAPKPTRAKPATTAKADKPASKKPEPKIIDAEIVDEEPSKPSAMDTKIEKLIELSVIDERAINIYFGQKKMIDQDTGSFRDLSEDMKKKLHDQFDGLVETLTKGGN